VIPRWFGELEKQNPLEADKVVRKTDNMLRNVYQLRIGDLHAQDFFETAWKVYRSVAYA